MQRQRFANEDHSHDSHVLYCKCVRGKKCKLRKAKYSQFTISYATLTWFSSSFLESFNSPASHALFAKCLQSTERAKKSNLLHLFSILSFYLRRIYDDYNCMGFVTVIYRFQRHNWQGDPLKGCFVVIFRPNFFLSQPSNHSCAPPNLSIGPS